MGWVEIVGWGGVKGCVCLCGVVDLVLDRVG